jgi:hypothetical protein
MGKTTAQLTMKQQDVGDGVIAELWVMGSGRRHRLLEFGRLGIGILEKRRRIVVAQETTTASFPSASAPGCGGSRSKEPANLAALCERLRRQRGIAKSVAHKRRRMCRVSAARNRERSNEGYKCVCGEPTLASRRLGTTPRTRKAKVHVGPMKGIA